MQSLNVSIISLKQKVFCDTRKCLFRCWTNKLWYSTRIYLRVTPLPNIHIDLPQPLNETGTYLYVDDTCIFYQDKDVEKIEKVLNNEFTSLCEWFIDNKLSIHFGHDKTKTIFFSRMKSPPKLNIYGDYSLKQHNTVEYLGCYLDSNLNRESMARRVLKKINTKLNFLWKQCIYLKYSSRRLLCNALVQPHFDYGCTSWYPLLRVRP